MFLIGKPKDDACDQGKSKEKGKGYEGHMNSFAEGHSAIGEMPGVLLVSDQESS